MTVEFGNVRSVGGSSRKAGARLGPWSWTVQAAEAEWREQVKWSGHRHPRKPAICRGSPAGAHGALSIKKITAPPYTGIHSVCNICREQVQIRPSQ